MSALVVERPHSSEPVKKIGPIISQTGIRRRLVCCLQGPYRKELRELFQAEIPDELRHAQFLSDKIAVLGGTPTTTARKVPQATHAADMLRQIFEAEHRAVVDYAQRAKDADGCGETGLKVELENIVVDETRHRDEIEQILAGWDRSEYA